MLPHSPGMDSAGLRVGLPGVSSGADGGQARESLEGGRMAGCSKEGVEGNEESRFESEGVAGSGVGVLGLSCDALMLSCGRERQVDGTGSSCSQVEGDQEVDVRRPPNF
jgi:hypothetical protein